MSAHVLKGIYQKIPVYQLSHGWDLAKENNFKNYCYDSRKEKSKS